MVDKRGGAALDLYKKGIIKGADWKAAKELDNQAHEHVDIRKVPENRERFGTVPVTESKGSIRCRYNPYRL